jgi:phosphate/sulfate permease
MKANALKSAANIAYYGGTLGAGVGMYQLMNNPAPISIVVVLVFTLTVEGLLSTLLTEALDRPIARLQAAAASATTPTTAKGDHR